MTGPDMDPGWYRVTDRGWEPVTGETAQEEIDAGGGWDLVHVNDTTTHTLTADPLF